MTLRFPGFVPDPVLTAADPADLDPYDYAYGNPVTNEDPSGDRPTGANNCGSDEDDCSTVPPDQPSLNLTDVAEGALDGLYETGAGILAMGAYGQGEYGLAKSISNSPLPFANRDPDDPSFSLGIGGAFVASLVVPGGEEADAATLTTDALTDTARTATSAVKTAAEDTGPSGGGTIFTHFTDGEGVKGHCWRRARQPTGRAEGQREEPGVRTRQY